MSAQMFDLGMRLRAAQAAQPVLASTHAPALPLQDPVAVCISTAGGRTTVEASDGTSTFTEHGANALAALDRLGISATGSVRTLVMADQDSLADLAALAHAHPKAPSAPVVGWWDQRGDHPGSNAVHLAVPLAAMRWTLGTAPEREADLATWLTWLSIPRRGPEGLLELARLTTASSPLPGLLDLAESDGYSWEKYLERLSRGWNWRSSDGRAEAAMGLTSRSHAAELYESLRLHDPLVALRASFTGTVVTGTVTHVAHEGLVLEAERPISRLRVGSAVEGWCGEAQEVSTASKTLRTGHIAASRLTPGGTLAVTITDHIARPEPITVGERLSLRPKAVDPFQQRRARGRMSGRYRSDGNWIAGRGAPIVRRSDVPLDVVLAAADE